MKLGFLTAFSAFESHMKKPQQPYVPENSCKSICTTWHSFRDCTVTVRNNLEIYCDITSHKRKLFSSYSRFDVVATDKETVRCQFFIACDVPVMLLSIRLFVSRSSDHIFTILTKTSLIKMQISINVSYLEGLSSLRCEFYCVCDCLHCYDLLLHLLRNNRSNGFKEQEQSHLVGVLVAEFMELSKLH